MPEHTSLSRATSFNIHNVMQFYENYETLKNYNFTPNRIFNLDETNILTVVQAPNVIAQTGIKQVGQSVSAERGQLITMCGIRNATAFLPFISFQDNWDTGGGQNWNQQVTAVLMHAVQKVVHLKRVELKFLESGHSHMECDSMHSAIKSAKTNKQPLLGLTGPRSSSLPGLPNKINAKVNIKFIFCVIQISTNCKS